MSGNTPVQLQPWSEMNLMTMEGGRPLGTATMSDGNGFLQPFGAGAVCLGYNRSGRPVGLRDDRHMLICAGTRGGKGVSMIVPNLCLWPGSTVVIDPKGENAMVTARRRAAGSRYCHGMGQKVHILDPMQTVGTADDSFADLKAGYNPLTLLAGDNAESVDIAAWIADALIVSESSNDPYWENAARELLRSIILHVADMARVQGRRAHAGHGAPFAGRGGQRSAQDCAARQRQGRRAVRASFPVPVHGG